MKPDHIDQYSEEDALTVQSALLTLWPRLYRWRDYLVLVGGMVPRYICSPASGETVHYRLPMTLDADFGIALGASADGMASLRDTLAMQGFHALSGRGGGGRHEWERNGVKIPVDFLTEHPPHETGAVQVEDITANVRPGIDRALAISRWVPVCGVNLWGEEQQIRMRVCEVGPFLALKLRAFAHRRAAKDAFDILYTVLHYDGGVEAAAQGFADEVKAGNPACADALRSLHQDFTAEESLGPTRAAGFLFGEDPPRRAGEERTLRLRVAQQMVDVARLLQGRLG